MFIITKKEEEEENISGIFLKNTFLPSSRLVHFLAPPSPQQQNKTKKETKIIKKCRTFFFRERKKNKNFLQKLVTAFFFEMLFLTDFIVTIWVYLSLSPLSQTQQQNQLFFKEK